MLFLKPNRLEFKLITPNSSILPPVFYKWWHFWVDEPKSTIFSQAPALHSCLPGGIIKSTSSAIFHINMSEMELSFPPQTWSPSYWRSPPSSYPPCSNVILTPSPNYWPSSSHLLAGPSFHPHCHRSSSPVVYTTTMASWLFLVLPPLPFLRCPLITAAGSTGPITLLPPAAQLWLWASACLWPKHTLRLGPRPS